MHAHIKVMVDSNLCPFLGADKQVMNGNVAIGRDLSRKFGRNPHSLL